MAEFSISSRAKKTNTMISEMLRACVTRGVIVFRQQLGTHASCGTADGNNIVASGPACGVCPPDLLLPHPGLSVILVYYSLRTLAPIMPVVAFTHARDNAYPAPMCMGQSAM